MKYEFKKGGYERIARILLVVSIGITIVFSILFLWKRSFTTAAKIDASSVGQFGDVIGGFVGTLVALVSFFLLYETLNEQRTQFFKQSKDNRKELAEQKKQFQKQNEDQIFYHLLDRLQNRINNMFILEQDKKFVGFDVLKLIHNRASEEYRKILLKTGSRIISKDILSISDAALRKLVQRWYVETKGIDRIETGEYEESKYDVYKAQFNAYILQIKVEDRWETLRHNLFNQDGWQVLESEAIRLAISSFHQRVGSLSITDYIEAFKLTVKGDFHILEGYFNDVQFLCDRIENSTEENKDFYYKYFSAQLTSNEKLALYYYLLSGRAEQKFWHFAKKYRIFSDIKKTIPNGDTYPEAFFEGDLILLDSIYK